jgi:hypothetical protein
MILDLASYLQEKQGLVEEALESIFSPLEDLPRFMKRCVILCWRAEKD